MTTNEIRTKFLEFFKSKAHTIVPSDSLVPADDPSLLFTGAGMNQFKDKFLGRNVTYKRAATCQKCLRTGDLDRVGKTSGHHTFFEMLGNFSFGDYFKKEAITWAWEFFTKILKLNPDRLRVSVYSDDEEAYGIWKDIVKIQQSKIIKFGEKDNYWPSEAPTKGPNGPCGPCSEIFYDYGAGEGCKLPGCNPACDCGRFIEVWNLVFTQFDRQPDGKLKPLPNKNIDTGMGLERIASVMQGVKTNFEIDSFAPIVKSIERLMEKPEARVQKPGKKAKINAIADHIRAATFIIADGVMPSNEERGYVVRKLIRRASSHARDLGIEGQHLYKLTSTAVEVMKVPYPELVEKTDEIASIIKREEDNFRLVIENQLPKVEEAFGRIINIKDPAVIAETAFNFYDTYGMPYDMLEEVCEKRGLRIDRDMFDGFLEKQRKLSRSRTKIKSDIFSETFTKKVEALGLKTEFLGYDKSRAQVRVLAVLEGGEVILDSTPFYGESGGQIGDWGSIETPSGVMEVEDAKKIGQTIVHIGSILRGKIVKGEQAKVSIDEERRRKIMANHTATHLLQGALRKVLGPHVRQTGSLVDETHLRFDFTHTKKMEPRELSRVEELVNVYIKNAIPVKKEMMNLEDAKLDGATALFGEKYDATVRVITIGDVSKELCGGTHAGNTSDISVFKIKSESSIASGVRRIEALTGEAAAAWLSTQDEAQSLKLKSEAAKEEAKRLMKERIKTEIGNIDCLISNALAAGAVKIITSPIDDIDISGLRILSDKIREKEKSAVIILTSISEGKVSFITSVTDDLVKKGVNAGNIAKDLANLVDGSGGGRPNFAQGGGKAPDKLNSALKKLTEDLKERL